MVRRSRVPQPLMPVEDAERWKPIADHAHVADESFAVPEPEMEETAWWFHHGRQPCHLPQVEGDLVRGRGPGAGHRAREAADDRPVEMSAHDAFDLRVPPDDRFELAHAIEPHLVQLAH